MTNRSILSSTEGFTLMEVMIAVFMLAFVAMIFAAVFPTGQISRVKATHMTYAVNLAEQRIEEIKSAGYSNVLVAPTVNTSLSELPNGNLSTTISQYSPHVRKVEVQVTWSGYRQVGGSTDLVTLISDHS